jgi:hypothetical protein
VIDDWWHSGVGVDYACIHRWMETAVVGYWKIEILERLGPMDLFRFFLTPIA